MLRVDRIDFNSICRNDKCNSLFVEKYYLLYGARFLLYQKFNFQERIKELKRFKKKFIKEIIFYISLHLVQEWIK